MNIKSCCKEVVVEISKASINEEYPQNKDTNTSAASSEEHRSN